MIDSFTQLFEKSIKNINIYSGMIIKGLIISITKNIVLVDANLKSEATIPIEQFYDIHGNLEIKVGDIVDVMLDNIENGLGETLLSREKAKKQEIWNRLEKIYHDTNITIGVVSGKVKGGFTVELHGVRAFLPGSLVDIKPVKDIDLEGKELEFKIIKLDKKRNNIVVSRRAILELEHNNYKLKLLSSLQEGMIVKGIVKNLTDYGAFIDLGGVDGLLHITDIAWKRVKHPSEIINLGEEITVKVLKFDKEQTRVSLGLKQLKHDPWLLLIKKYSEGNRLQGKVTNITDYGCFVEIDHGIEGLVHVSEMDWTNKNIHPSKLVNINDMVEVIILNIDHERRRISLGIKQCKINPWKNFASLYNKGDCVSGKIKSITDFGMFIELDGGIDGLIHTSDISWETNSGITTQQYKKGDIVKSLVLQVDAERERISLGIKQLTEDPLNIFFSNYKNEIVSGVVKSLDEDNSINLNLVNNIDGYLSNESINTKYNKDLAYINIGDTLKVRVDNIDRKNRRINVLYYNSNLDKKINLNQDKKLKNNNKFSNTMREAFKAATKED
ncbi:MAG: 30S ribosomal protein S1 [Candidatus Lightella neohaematopini]|nr:30S ribosomal protein S1 [Candidatus Lightella neohaematopini]MCV2528784.1 30S ribosomal protein S1 [Candidatus Lightella neohaematopini]